MANEQNLKPFKKGYDPRRNLKGVPRDVVAMRKHMRKIAAEIIGEDETAMTRLDAMLRMMTSSRNPAHNKMVIQILYKDILKEIAEITGKDGGAIETKIIVEYADDDNDNADDT